MRRAAPLPNSVRVSALIFSGSWRCSPRTCWLFLSLGASARRRSSGAHPEDQPALSITESRGNVSLAEATAEAYRRARAQGEIHRVGGVTLTLAEARARAAQLSEVSYDVALDLTEPGSRHLRLAGPPCGSAPPAPDTFLELADATRPDASSSTARRVEPAYDGGRIHLTGLPTDGVNEVVVEARLPYVTDGDGMHRIVDPADGETYVAAYLGMDIAQKVFACFDQNDLKAPIATDGAAPTRRGRCWPTAARSTQRRRRPVAVRHHAADPGRRSSSSPPGRGHSRALGARRPAVRLARPRARSPPSSTGTSTELRRDHRGLLRPLRRDVRRALRVRLLRPGRSCPGLNWGAQEMPGCVTYRDELLPRGQVPDGRAGLPRLGDRARDVAHVVRRPGDDDLVGGHLAAGVLRRLHGLPGRRRRRRLRRRRWSRTRSRQQAGGVRRRRSAARPTRSRPRARGRARRRRRGDDLRRDLLRQGQLGAPPAGRPGSATRSSCAASTPT